MRDAGVERVVLWARVLGTREPGFVSQAPAAAESPVRRSRPSARGEAGASMATAVRSLEARLKAGGGQLHAQLSGQLVASFAAKDVLDAVELGLELLDEASGYDLAIALALSGTWRDGPVLVGHAFDDACFLAARANPGELLVDGSVRERVPGHFLYARQVTAGGLRAASVDRRHPRRADCLHALVTLGRPPLVGATRALLEPLTRALAEEGALVVLEGPTGAGASELVEAAREALGVRRVLAVGAAAGPLVPLESLRLTLGAGGTSTGPAAVLARGGLPSLQEVVGLLEAELDLAAEAGPVAWIVLNPLAAVDLATLEAVGALRAARSVRLRLVARAPLDFAVPPPLGRVDARLTLPALRMDDACEVVAAVLGPGTGLDVVRRVAITGGDSSLGCEEAARLLVSSGELVRGDEGFVWRIAPRGGPEAVAPEQLVQHRLELLPPEARRVLELVAVLAPGASRELIREMARADGMTPRELERALAVLAVEGWLGSHDAPSAHFLRRCVQRAMPPARLAELHRFAVDVLPQEGPERLAALHHALEGGLERQVVARALELAVALRRAGFVAAAAALPGRPEFSESASDRASDAAQGALHDTLAGAASPPATEASLAGNRPSTAAPYSPLDDVGGADREALREALRTRDVDALERWIEAAVAAGGDLVAIARLRALVDLLRGDVGNAEARLARTWDITSPRALLAQAMVVLGAGHHADAVRLALRALSLSLQGADVRGTSASLHTLAACYRAEGRVADADELAARAGRQTSTASSSS
ncbi:MAG: hypothetical protein OHK0013_21700 [Sandaracinaceae bacterium]